MTTISDVLKVVTGALGAIKTAGDVPGINLIPYVGTIGSIAGGLQFLIEKGQNVAENYQKFKDSFANGLPPKEVLDALDASIKVKRAKLHAPLPPKEAGEED